MTDTPEMPPMGHDDEADRQIKVLQNRMALRSFLRQLDLSPNSRLFSESRLPFSMIMKTAAQECDITLERLRENTNQLFGDGALRRYLDGSASPHPRRRSTFLREFLLPLLTVDWKTDD